jgi:Phosphoserine phosphatase RsbU, N-terminal domain/GAF domain
VSVGGGKGVPSFLVGYVSALTDYLHDPSERSLRVAYELGREAVSRQLSMLDLAVVHQEALLSALADVSGSEETQRVTRASGDFFLESLASFEMVQRGFREAKEAARLERRQTQMSRQLSTFLADASLVLDASESLEEMLRLVAEQARELVGAECCVATVTMGGQPRTAEAASFDHADRRWAGLVRWLDLFAIYRCIRTYGGSVRLAGKQLIEQPQFGKQLIEQPQFGSAAGDPPLTGWLAASLTALDGSELGAIQLFDKQDGAFTGDDEAVLVHLAQMASAAIERTRLYHESG